MRLGIILTTSERRKLCELSGVRIKATLEILKVRCPDVSTFVVLADDGTASNPSGPWDLIIKHVQISGIQRSFAAAYAALAPWCDIIWHLEDDRPLIPERCILVPKALAAFEHDARIGAFGLFAYGDFKKYLHTVTNGGCAVIDQYRHNDLDIFLFGFCEKYPWATFCFNNNLIRAKLVDETAVLGKTPLHIGELESVMARRVRDAGMYGAYSPQLHAISEDLDPGHSPGWNMLSSQGMRP